MPGKKTQRSRGLVVSDLHLFASRSDGLNRIASIRDRLSETDLVVLNGDIFDFRWSTHSGHAHSIREAIQWLLDFSRSVPHSDVHYVLGNHDCLVDFVLQLDAVKRDCSNFEWHEYSVQFNEHLFLHGDCTNEKMDKAALKRYRDFWSRDGRRHGPRTTVYQMSDRLGFTRLVHKFHFPRERTLQRLVHHLDIVKPHWKRSVQHCYFGHTHEPFSNVRHSDVTFHNTGCAIRGMQFNPIEFALNTGERPGQKFAKTTNNRNEGKS